MFWIKIAINLTVSALWRIGGNGDSRWRSPGVPLILSIFKVLEEEEGRGKIKSLVFGLAIFGVLTISYGITAPLHKFWVKRFGRGEDGNVWIVEFMTRWTCGLAWMSPMFIYGFNLERVLYYIVSSIAIGLIGATAKNVWVSELGVGAVVGGQVWVI